MSQEKSKVAVNLYGIVDNELARMHELLHIMIASQDRKASQPNMSYSYNGSTDPNAIVQRIMQIQNHLVEAMLSSDKQLQERVAELALTGSEET